MKNSIIILFFLCSLFGVRTLHADFIDLNKIGTVTFPALTVTGLEKSIGQQMTVYYVVGSRATLGVQKDQISVTMVRHKLNFNIESDTLKIPNSMVPRLGLYMPNMMVLVIHSPGVYIWRNADNTMPTGEEEISSHPTNIPILFAIDSLSTIELQALKDQQAGAPELTYRMVQ